MDIEAYCRRIFPWFSRWTLGVIYVWFGVLKVVGASPATPLVEQLQHSTLPFFDPATFLMLFGLFEVLIGVLFLIPQSTKIALGLMAFHMVTTTLPLVVLPHVVWIAPFVPTLEGQYIVKNLALIAVGIGIAANLDPVIQ